MASKNFSATFLGESPEQETNKNIENITKFKNNFLIFIYCTIKKNGSKNKNKELDTRKIFRFFDY
ncbi:hypothetical protein CAPN010_21240 [Capnocytophaga cynodegmi]|nr:hypothetical protein CAPN010_21240 [Capnocytophaga cynodegmi]